MMLIVQRRPGSTVIFIKVVCLHVFCLPLCYTRNFDLVGAIVE